MANPERGEARLVVDGREYKLQLTTNSQCELEARLSTPQRRVSIGDVMNDIARKSMTAVRAFVWAILRKHHGDEIATDEQVGDFIDKAGGPQVVMDAVLEAVQLAKPDPKDLEAISGGGKGRTANPPNAQQPGTGTRSTAPVAELV